jgi:peroxiredoxin
LPDLEGSIWSKYKGKGVLVYGLHPGENPKQLSDFIKQTGVTFPVVSDTGGTLNSFAFPSGVSYPYPRDVIIGKDLTVRAIRNSFNVTAVDTLVQQLLKE